MYIGDTISVHYDGFLEDGSSFDSSRTRDQPFEFTLGVKQVIPGWDQVSTEMATHQESSTNHETDSHSNFAGPRRHVHRRLVSKDAVFSPRRSLLIGKQL